MSANSNTLASITTVYLHKQDVNSLDWTPILKVLATTDLVLLNDSANNNYLTFSISTISLSGSVYTITVTSATASGSSFASNDVLYASFVHYGQSGFSGVSGTSGTSGFSGTSGTSGFSGTSGRSGFSGTSGTSGFSGASGSKGSVLPLQGAYFGVWCVEAARVLFLDIMELDAAETRHPVDPKFAEAVEPGTLQILSTHSEDIYCGAIRCRIDGTDVVLDSLWSQPGTIRVTLAGVRKGHNGEKWIELTEANYHAYRQFWANELG